MVSATEIFYFIFVRWLWFGYKERKMERLHSVNAVVPFKADDVASSEMKNEKNSNETMQLIFCELLINTLYYRYVLLENQ
jgi:hypothetical protein